MRVIVKYSIAIIYFSCITLLLNAANIKNAGKPYIQTYTKAIYKAGNQNWAVAKDSRGIMYYGNAGGLLSFDGQHWQLYQMPNKLIVRAVATDKEKVYVGGFGEFGYWAYDAKGFFKYTSLTRLVAGDVIKKDEIWKIYVDDKRVIFQSFACIYIYESGKITIVRANQPYLFLFKVNNKYIVQVISEGLYELADNKLHFIKGSENVSRTGVLSILPYKNNSLLICTRGDGLFVYDGTQFAPWASEASTFLKVNQLNNGVIIDNNSYAFGTILNGIIIIDDNGKIVQHINKTFGLQNNTVLSMYVDDAQDLWLGLDNGIDRVELNSPLYYYFDRSGALGTIYTSILYNGKIYLGTNHGLFYSDWNLSSNHNQLQPFDFKLINGSEGQVWNLTLIDDQLICGQNENTFVVKGDGLTRISNIGGGWIIKKLKTNPNVYIQGTYSGLVIYKKNSNGQLVFSNRLPGLYEPIRYIEEDDKGNLWIGHSYKGLYKLTLTDDYTGIESLKHYEDKSGFPSEMQINIFNFNDQIVFTCKQGIYYYDELSDSFVKNNQLNNKLGSFNTANNIIKADEKKYWFIDNGRVALVDISQAGKIGIDSGTFSTLQGEMIDYYENINKINDQFYLISVDEGFAIFDAGTPLLKTGTFPSVLIRDVKNITDASSVITENNNIPVVHIPFSQNNISISYALPYYKQSKVQYQYLLEGYSKQWSEWTTLTEKEFTNLKHGKYRFLVRAKINGETILSPTVYEFIISPPWYDTIWALIGYLIIVALIIYLMQQWVKKRMIKEQQELRNKMEQDKLEMLHKERLENEQRIARLKTEQLEADLAGKNRELANSAMNIVSKNELLQNISDEILKLKDKDGQKLPADQIKKIQKVINEGMNDERDWDLFENSFNETHENFFRKVKASYPGLSPNDAKLCAYLRMNMSSKEIASILNITLRGVEIRRYRLRKKLNLEHDQNLVDFLMML